MAIQLEQTKRKSDMALISRKMLFQRRGSVPQLTAAKAPVG